MKGEPLPSRDALLIQMDQLRRDLATAQAERDALRPEDISADECSSAVHAVRMMRDGYSYDGAAGVWWKTGSQPGVVEKAQQRADAAEARANRLSQMIEAAQEAIEAAGFNEAKWSPADVIRSQFTPPNCCRCGHPFENHTNAVCMQGCYSTGCNCPGYVDTPDAARLAAPKE
jgi:hypothetical protein